MKINKPKFITRITETLVIITTIIITPMAINYANTYRGYKAYGGEYLIPLLGLLIVMALETFYDMYKESKRRGKH